MAKVATPKVPNYTPEQATKMASDYVAGKPVDEIAKELGKSVRSVVQKLVTLKVYKPKEYTTKTGEKPEPKRDLADAIGAVLKMSENDISSLEKANKTALKVIWDALANSTPIDGDENAA